MITSTKNARIVAARKLTQRKHRQKQDRFLVEGLQLLGMALEVMTASDRVQPVELFFCEELFTSETAPRLLRRLTEAGAQPVAVAPPVMDSLSERDTSQGLAATFVLSRLEGSIEAVLAQARPKQHTGKLILVLDKLQDPGNLGTLIRTADAVGAAAVFLLEPAVDPFDPKTVRGTMGSIFTVPFGRTQALDQLLPRLAGLGYRLVGADARQGQPVWHTASLSGAVALVLGNEARGLSPELQPYLSDYVSLPLHGQAESLNVSVAGGVLMYEWLRQNKQS